MFCGVFKLTLTTIILNERISHFLKKSQFFAFLENSEFSGSIEPAFPSAISAVHRVSSLLRFLPPYHRPPHTLDPACPRVCLCRGLLPKPTVRERLGLLCRMKVIDVERSRE